VASYSVVQAYSEEEISVYHWAYDHMITTQPSIEKANMGGKITRAEIAKMIVNFVRTHTGTVAEYDLTRSCHFVDDQI